MSGTKRLLSKACYKCSETKPIEQFAKRSESLRIYRNICKKCWNEYFKELKAKDPDAKEKARSRMANWRASPENKEKELNRRTAKNTSAPDAVFRAAIHNAKMRASVTIVKADLWKLWDDQNGKCALTGLQMTWGKGKIQPTSISLDRIDPKGIYEVGNLRLICHAINAFKGQMTDDEMFTMALALIGNMKKPKLRLVS